MQHIHGEFPSLAPASKIDFFLKCQELLLAHHPASPFLCHSGNIAERIKHMQAFVTNYKGFAYQDDAVCTLYNKIIVTNPQEPEISLRANMYQPPAEHYNAITVDFVVFRALPDCMTFVQKNYESRLQYVLFVRHNKVKLYKTIDFMQEILKLPIM